jgi:hypothetical protein
MARATPSPAKLCTRWRYKGAHRDERSLPPRLETLGRDPASAARVRVLVSGSWRLSLALVVIAAFGVPARADEPPSNAAPQADAPSFGQERDVTPSVETTATARAPDEGAATDEAAEGGTGASPAGSTTAVTPSPTTPGDDDPNRTESASSAMIPSLAGLGAASGLLPASDRPTVNVGGFAVITVQGNSTTPTPRIDVGQLTVHATVDLGANFGAFTEVTVNSVPSWEVRVERLLLFWEQSDHLKLSIGRYHLPVTWWNATFHHGLWLQTTLRRPTIVGFNDAFVPNHAVGVMADGAVPGMAFLGLRYHASLTGGGNDHFYMHGDHTAEKPRLAYTGSLFVEPPAMTNLRAGIVAYHDPDRIRGNVVTPETTLAAHVAWTGEAPEFIAEVVQVNHADTTGDGAGGSYASFGGYVQAAWRLPVLHNAWKPYARLDWMQIDTRDLALANSKSQHMGTIGLRFDPTSWLAMKLDGAYRQVAVTPGETLVAFQVEAAW